jgi:nucleotide-binding universal stress UspA family protein
MTPHDDRRVLVGFDGSLGAAGAIELAARLLPGRRAWIAHLRAPLFAATEGRARLSQRAGTVREMVELLEREAQADAERISGDGVTLAAAAGWPSEPYLKRAYGAEGLELAALAEELGPEVVVVGDDGSPGAARAMAAARELFPEREQVPVHAQDAGSGRAVAEALVNRARSQGAGLIVVGSRGRSAGREIMLGSAAMALLHHADRPVLVVPAARSAATA